jgi:hypothetical protein
MISETDADLAKATALDLTARIWDHAKNFSYERRLPKRQKDFCAPHIAASGPYTFQTREITRRRELPVTLLSFCKLRSICRRSLTSPSRESPLRKPYNRYSLRGLATPSRSNSEASIFLVLKPAQGHCASG